MRNSFHILFSLYLALNNKKTCQGVNTARALWRKGETIRICNGIVSAHKKNPDGLAPIRVFTDHVHIGGALKFTTASKKISYGGSLVLSQQFRLEGFIK